MPRAVFPRSRRGDASPRARRTLPPCRAAHPAACRAGGGGPPGRFSGRGSPLEASLEGAAVAPPDRRKDWQFPPEQPHLGVVDGWSEPPSPGQWFGGTTTGGWCFGRTTAASVVAPRLHYPRGGSARGEPHVLAAVRRSHHHLLERCFKRATTAGESARRAAAPCAAGPRVGRPAGRKGFPGFGGRTATAGTETRRAACVFAPTLAFHLFSGRPRQQGRSGAVVSVLGS